MTLAAGNRRLQIDSMLERVDDYFDDSLVTDWERNFIESISEQFDNRGDLSDKQVEILERIYYKLP